jgi:protein-disulfide isomerase
MSDNGRRPSNESKDPKKGRIVIFSSIIVIVLIGAIVMMILSNQNRNEAKPKKKQPTHRTEQVARIDYQDQPFIGSSNAPIKVVEFSDYRCPYCKEFEETVFPKINKDYVKTGKISFYYINYTILGSGSVLAANASEEVYHQNPKAFWAFHKAIFDAQKSEKEQWVTKKLLIDIAKKTVPSIDLKALESALDNKSRQSEVDKDTAIAESLGVQGTPMIFVNDQVIDGGQDYQVLKQAIDNALASKK